MKLRKALLWLLIACLLISIPAALAGEGDEGGSSSEPGREEQVKEPDPTKKPDPEPEPTKAPEPKTEEPEKEPTPEPEKTNDPTQVPEATSEPEKTDPTSEPDPSDDPTAVPTEEPDEPTSEPTPVVTPTPTPTPIVEPIVITVKNKAEKVKGVWMIQLSSPREVPEFTWTCDVENTGYIVTVNDVQITEEVTEENFISLMPGTYSDKQLNMIRVGAVLKDGTTVLSELKFQIASGFPGPGPFPGRFPGGMSRGEDGMNGDTDMGFHITPGVALTSSHSSGTMDLTAFGAAQFSTGEPISRIEQETTGASLELKNGGLFTAEMPDDVLVLKPEAADAEWQLSASMLKAFERAGIDHICFVVGNDELLLSTDMHLQGDAWGRLRSEGIVSGKCILLIGPVGIRAQIESDIYFVNGDGELLPASPDED